MARRTLTALAGTKNYNKEHFEQHIHETKTCWIWTGSISNVGYGLVNAYDNIRKRGQMVTAHRLAWIIYHDQDIPPKMHVHHSCHEKLCVNPAHLSLGTQRQKLIAMYRDNIMPKVRAPGAGRPRKNK
jgi:hypothetical protein